MICFGTIQSDGGRQLGKGGLYKLEYWFEKPGGGLGALRRNAISRLCWTALLTVPRWESDSSLLHLASTDRYKYTRMLLSKAWSYKEVLEWEYGSDSRIGSPITEGLG